MRWKGEKGKAWEAVRASIYRREQDCYTCPKKELVGANRGCGHYLPVALVGSNNTLSWVPELIHLQCMRCNGVGQGMAVEYRNRLVREYGEKRVLEWETRRHKIDPVKDWKSVKESFESR